MPTYQHMSPRIEAITTKRVQHTVTRISLHNLASLTLNTLIQLICLKTVVINSTNPHSVSLKFLVNTIHRAQEADTDKSIYNVL